LYALLYEQKGQEMNADITLKKVLKLNQAQFGELQSSLLNQNNSSSTTQHNETEEESKKEEGTNSELSLKS
jgi:protein required for attachment to host cells